MSELTHCPTHGRHWFTTYRSMERVDHCVRCGVSRAEVIKAQRQARQNKRKKARKDLEGL